MFPVVARRSDRVRGAAAFGPAAASSTRSSRTTRRSTCWRSRSSPRPRAASTREDELFALVRGAWPYRALDRAPIRRASCRWWRRASRRGAAGAPRSSTATRSTPRVRGRRGARLLAQTSGGAIPEIADYRVVLDPDDTFIGTLNEDFAIESNAGDIFQLGNASWRDPAGRRRRPCAWPTRRARRRPSRSGWARRRPAATSCRARSAICAREVDRPARTSRPTAEPTRSTWLTRPRPGLDAGRAPSRPVAYLAEGRRALGVIPTQDTLVLERFFDESGGMQLVLHAPFGSRINKAWGLALRKRFCRQFNFELQAAATEDALMLSLGPQHSFPLVGRVPLPAPARRRATCWCRRSSTRRCSRRDGGGTPTISLAVPRDARRPQGGAADAADAGRRPDGGGLPRRRRVPREHSRRSADSRSSARRADGARLPRGGDGLRRAARGAAADPPRRAAAAWRATRRSRRVFAHEILEREAVRVPGRCAARGAAEPGRADAARHRRRVGAATSARSTRRRSSACATRRGPDPRDADELHDALLTAGFLTDGELDDGDPSCSTQLIARRRRRARAAPSRVGIGGRSRASRRGRRAAARAAAPIHPGRGRSSRRIAAAARRGCARSWTRDDGDRRARCAAG